MKEFNIRLGDLQLSSCDKTLLISHRPHTTAEISLWSVDGDFRWVIARWKEHKEGWDLAFLGKRPFDERVNREDFWWLAETGQQLLDRSKEAEDAW